MRRIGRRGIALTFSAALAAAVLGSCSDKVGPTPPPPPPSLPPPPRGLWVSEPVLANGVASASRITGSQRLENASVQEDTLVYVSLTQGSAPTGIRATVRRFGDATSITTPMVVGGFDPVPLVARVGDSIEVVITNVFGGIVQQSTLIVAAARRPIVVRTQPPPRKRDVPLNSTLVMVFSEPLSVGSLSGGAISLFRASNSVAGTTRFLDSSFGTGSISVEFVPDAPLAAGATYQLVMTSLVRDLAGDALIAPDTVEFTTGVSLTGPPATVRMSIDTNLVLPEGTTYQLTATVWDSAGHQLTDTPVSWSTENQDVVAVSSTGLVHALSPGIVIVRAQAGQAGVGHNIVVPFPPPASVTITPANDTIEVGGSGGYVLLTPLVQDSMGRNMTSLTRSICWLSSDSLVAHFGGNRDSVCVVNPYYPYGIGVYGIDTGTVTITARVTVRPSMVLEHFDTTVTGTTSLYVGAKPGVASITLSPDSLTTVPSASYLLRAVVRARDGHILSDRPVEWASDASGVAIIDSVVVDSTVIYPGDGWRGLHGAAVRALGPGVATISGTSEGVTAIARLRVVAPTFSSVSAGDGYTCGVANGGAAFCWSAEVGAQQGLGLYVVFYAPAPAQVIGGFTFSEMSAGPGYACAVTTDARGKCWGTLPAKGTVWSPQDVASSPDGVLSFAQISRGAAHTCGLTPAKAAYCWGDNSYGQLGHVYVSSTDVLVPRAVGGELRFESVSAGGRHTCAVATGGTAYCWGWNYLGQLGDGNGGGFPEQWTWNPTQVAGALELTRVTAGSFHTCGATTTGAAYCWGYNDRGQLGDSTTTKRLSPVPVTGGLSFTTITAGDRFTCGVTAGGAAYCWGRNDRGQLGDGTTTDRWGPALVGGQLTFDMLSAGYDHVCGLATDGVLYCWGDNSRGQLGDGSTVNRSMPVKVAGQP